MQFHRDTLAPPGPALNLLRELVHQRTGLLFENGRGELLTERLSPLVLERGFTSFLDYYYLLKYDSAADDEWNRVIDVLSVQETYFWREMEQVRALVDIIVPAHFKSPGARPLCIWSAACATGEEPLSIAIALNEAGWLQRAPIQIYGSDASPRAIERARAGVYRERSFRSLPVALRDKYFTASGGISQIAPEIHNRIIWRVANLAIAAQITELACASIVFCRNVFIYFSESSIQATLNTLSKLIASPGYLFVGASESLLRLTKAFEFEEIGNAFAYVKR